MPAIVGKILGHLAEFDHFPEYVSTGVPVGPLAADPAKPRPSPDHTKVRLAKAIPAARVGDARLKHERRCVGFADDLDHWAYRDGGAVWWYQTLRSRDRGKLWGEIFWQRASGLIGGA